MTKKRATADEEEIKMSKKLHKIRTNKKNKSKQELKKVPRLLLNETGSRALLSVEPDKRTPISLTDIQQLLSTVLLKNDSPRQPQRWCNIEHANAITPSVVLIIEGLSLQNYNAYPSAFTATASIFEQPMELEVPPMEKGSLIKELAQVPLMMTQTNKLNDLHGSMLQFDTQKSEQATDLHADDRFPRTKLLLSALQMIDEGYPMPLRGELGIRFKHYKFTKDKYTPVTNRSPMFGIDCEMCLTTHTNELTRISVVNEKMETLYETLVRPRYAIVDYLTRFSGITPEIMLNATKTLDDVQADISELLPSDAILVGQSLNSDLNAMQMMHPYVIDTSVCFNLTGVRKRKSKLKLLSEKFLKELIQGNIDGHDSVEDSIATLKLVKLKLTQGLDFGDTILLRKRRYQVIREYLENNAMYNKIVAMVSTESSLDEQLKMSTKNKEQISVHECVNNKMVIKKTSEIVSDHALVLSNIRIETENLETQEILSNLQKVDKYINKVWKSLPHNGMFVIIMGNAKESATSGLAHITFKNDPNLLSGATGVTE